MEEMLIKEKEKWSRIERIHENSI
jgi:hypothetical protein